MKTNPRLRKFKNQIVHDLLHAEKQYADRQNCYVKFGDSWNIYCGRIKAVGEILDHVKYRYYETTGNKKAIKKMVP